MSSTICRSRSTTLAFSKTRVNGRKESVIVKKAPPVDLTKEINYFNNDFQHHSLPEYDLYFAYTKTQPLWDERKGRDNRSYLPDIHENIFQQEKLKPIPALTSMNYGRPCRIPYDISDITYRRQNATSDFKRRRGMEI